MLLPSVLLLLELDKSLMVIRNGEDAAVDWVVVEDVTETDGTVEVVNKDGIVSDINDGVLRDGVVTKSRDWVDADDEDRVE